MTASTLRWIALLAAPAAAAACSNPTLTKAGGDDNTNIGLPDQLDANFSIRDGGEAGAAAGGCHEDNFAATTMGLDLFFAVSSSGSMTQVIDQFSKKTKWDAQVDALTKFFSDPRSAGLGVAMSFFPTSIYTNKCDETVDCGKWGPCVLPFACSNSGTGNYGWDNPCVTANDCFEAATCERLGYCSIGAKPCINVGNACPPGEGACVAAHGKCTKLDAYPSEAPASCDPRRFFTPAAPFADLPAASDALIKLLNIRRPLNDSYVANALEAALNSLQIRAAKFRGRRGVAVLTTDGTTGLICGRNDAAARIAADAFAATPSIPTYVIGVVPFANSAMLVDPINQIAAAGGTGEATLVRTGEDSTKDFLEALKQVQIKAIPCEYKIPDLMGTKVDYGTVNVARIGMNGEEVVLGYTGGDAACDPAKGGWYYDVDPKTGTPEWIIACASTCETFKKDPTGRVEIRYGCKTKLIE